MLSHCADFLRLLDKEKMRNCLNNNKILPYSFLKQNTIKIRPPTHTELTCWCLLRYCCSVLPRSRMLRFVCCHRFAHSVADLLHLPTSAHARPRLSRRSPSRPDRGTAVARAGTQRTHRARTDVTVARQQHASRRRIHHQRHRDARTCNFAQLVARPR